ncbi:MAG TPA: sialidase family protein [Gaiellaceae bacterium]
MLAKAVAFLAAGAVMVLVPLGAAQTTDRGTLPLLTEASHDMCTGPLSYHSSEVEPMTAAHGQMLVSTFQVGRVYDGGSCDIGWSTSTDGGRTWQTGLLPLTVFGGQATTGAGPLSRASDPAVAYDAQDGVWLIDSLGLAGDANTVGLFVNRSTDGINWDPPITTEVGSFPDKNWITCDNWPDSAGYGNCYQEWDNGSETIKMQTSTDGGLTWSPPANTADNAQGIGGVPLVQPPPPNAPPGSACGRVVVPIATSGVSWFTSSDCGATWSATTLILPNMTAEHLVAGGFRTSLLPGSAMDGAGAIYVAWQTRSFRTQNTTLAAAAAAGASCVRLANISGLAAGQTLRIDPNGAHPEVVTIGTVGATVCNSGQGATITPVLAYAHAAGAFVTKNNVANNSSSDPNDIAMSVMPAPTAANPTPIFGGPVRIPIEADSGGQSNTNDHFIPGIAADRNTSGSSAHLGLFYYSYPVANCQAYNYDSLCHARVGYVSSPDAGAHWTAPLYLASMTLAEIALSSQGPMVGDYTGADVVPEGACRGRAIEAFAVGLEPQADDNALSEPMYAPTCGLRIGIGNAVRPATKPPEGRAPAPALSLHRTAH